MKEIPLTQGKVALVDDDDHEEVMRYRWFAIKKKGSLTWYASSTEYIGNGASRPFYMHHLIMGRAHDRMEIDHRNGNGIDNQRGNLRWVTHAQQMKNIRPTAGRTSAFKGVHRHIDGRWRARIRVAKKNVHLGLFVSEEAAARAYDAMAYETFGEFGYLNFPRVNTDDMMTEGERQW